MMVRLKDLFYIEYGNQADLNKLQKTTSREGIRFISRSSENLGFQCYVSPVESMKIYSKGDITVTLGGSCLLSSFVQPSSFYTAQNIKILSPKQEMTEAEKHFYCYAIAHNRFRYTSHGREANKTLDELLVPELSEIPDWVNVSFNIDAPDKSPCHDKIVGLTDREWKWFQLEDFFRISAGKYYRADSYSDGKVPLVSSTNKNNGIKNYTDLTPVYNKVSLTIGKISASTFVQFVPFVASPDVTVLEPNKIPFNESIGLFVATVINQENYKWSYGRQIRLSDAKKLRVKLPANKDGHPDWKFMEYYIKSLPYSSNLKGKKHLRSTKNL